LRDQAYPDANMDEIFDLFLSNCKGLVIFTFGEKELWYARNGEKVKKFKPYNIIPVDTTAAGDSFRGAIAYGLLKKWSDEETVKFASAVAACVCLTLPHTLGAPDLAGVRKFMEDYRE
jgi:sugar/nucleoside kinase (ribokinase family)